MSRIINDNISGVRKFLDNDGIKQDFLQLIPAEVTGVINSAESVINPSLNPGESNMITVKKSIWTSDGISLSGMDKKKYKPLLRGIADSITIGDEVLITYIGPQGYYLGPINILNSPTHNPSNSSAPDSTTTPTNSKTDKTSVNFSSATKFSRIVKDFNIELDDPTGTRKKITHPVTGNEVFSDIHTDMTLEGRHGNSINIGSRSIFPYILISNGRDPDQTRESINDSSLFAMFQYGTLAQQFKNEKLDGNEYTFKLADESILEPSNTIRTSFLSSLGRGQGIDGEDDSAIEETIYDYNTPQTLLNSNRIIFNARKDNIYLSAFKHIHLGSGNTMTFSTSKNMLFNVTETYVVKSPEIKLGSEIDDETQPLVLGDTLIEKLTEMNDHLQEIVTQIQAITVPTPAGPSGPPVNSAAFNMPANALNKLIGTLNEFLSSQNRTV